MRPRFHVASLFTGLAAGVGLTLLVAAAAGPRESPADGAVGRYQVRTASREGTSTAYVVDTVSGDVFVVQEQQGGGNVIRPPWAK